MDELRRDKVFRWELTFHPAESSKLGQIATQYDRSIIDILYAIRDKRITVNDVYLPLLFLFLSSSSYTGIQILSCVSGYYTCMVLSRIVL